jgi:hypothetical protein
MYQKRRRVDNGAIDSRGFIDEQLLEQQVPHRAFSPVRNDK